MCGGFSSIDNGIIVYRRGINFNRPVIKLIAHREQRGCGELAVPAEAAAGRQQARTRVANDGPEHSLRRSTNIILSHGGK